MGEFEDKKRVSEELKEQVVRYYSRIWYSSQQKYSTIKK